MSETAKLHSSGAEEWPEEQDGRRKYRRVALFERGRLVVGGAVFGCNIVDVSPGGALVSLDSTDLVEESSEVVLKFDGFGSIPAEVVHLTEGNVGLMFLYDAAARDAFTDWLTLKVNL